MLPIRVICSFLLALTLLGCGGVTLSPLTAEDRSVTPTQGATESIMLNEPIVWQDKPMLDGPGEARAIKLPQGKYVAEAVETDYVYYRAPSEIEYRIFRDGRVADARNITGGLLLAKSAFSPMPAGAYMSVDASHKVMTFKMGPGFMQLEGKQWVKNR